MILDRRIFSAGLLGGLMVPALALKSRAHDRLHDLAIRDFTFDPPDLAVRVGDHIRVTNHDLAPHTATALDGSWDTGTLDQGDSIDLTVTEDWTGAYFCAFHPAMEARLEISPA